MRFRPILIAVAAGSLFGIAAPAFAQDDDVVVYAPYTHSPRAETSASGVPIAVTTRSIAVSTRDLDLRRDRDVNELYRRVNYTAQEACDDINRMTVLDNSLTTDRQCMREAVLSARPQVDAMVTRARY